MFFFFNDTATTEIYTLSLHDALPIYAAVAALVAAMASSAQVAAAERMIEKQAVVDAPIERSEEHTSELQSRLHLVCRLLLEKKNTDRAPQLTVISGVELRAVRECM